MRLPRYAQVVSLLPVFALQALAPCSWGAEHGPYFATGIKIGEVTDHSAVVWTRLTARAARNPDDAPGVRVEYDSAEGAQRRAARVRGVVFERGATVGELRQAAPGCDGDARVGWRSSAESPWQYSPWQAVDSLHDFTRQFALEGLAADQRYELHVESRDIHGQPGATISGAFHTAPAADRSTEVLFTVTTGHGDNDQDDPGGFKIYTAMQRLGPRFMAHTGDIIYYDQLAKTVELARYHWQRMYSWPLTLKFHREVPVYFMRDDHDTWVNDCWPALDSPYMHEFTFRQGQAIFAEQTPLRGPTWRTFRWGRDLQIWLVEGRDFRSPNDAPDGPEKTIWGAEQKAWVKQTLAASDATFRVLISPTPIVGPDRSSKADNHSNFAFAHEGRELRAFLGGQKNTLVLCGDRHWQYASVDRETGLREYTCGPASDIHAGGWKAGDTVEGYHRYVNVIGGFLSARVARQGEQATITLRHHDVEGEVKFEDVIAAR